MQSFRLISLLLYSAHGLGATPGNMMAVVSTGRVSNVTDLSKIKVVNYQPVPTPGEGQVLIRVMSSSVNPVDYKMQAYPFMSNVTPAHPKVLGLDVSGVIEQTGPGCSRLKAGDEIWAAVGKVGAAGAQLGAWAEYAVADESQVGLKPTSMSFADAALLPLVGFTDVQALRMTGAPWTDKHNVSVVITSGSGGTGLLAIQLAKSYGATRIITSSSPSHVELLKQLGATDVIDYHESSIWEAFPENSVDVVFDNFGAEGTADAAMKVLRPGGVFIFLPGKNGGKAKHAKAGVQQINYGNVNCSPHEDLDLLKEAVDAGHVKAVMGQQFALPDIKEAFRTVQGGHVTGKVGIKIGKDQSPIVV